MTDRQTVQVGTAVRGDWDWEEALIDIAHEVGTYRIKLTDSRSLPLLVEKITHEFYMQHALDMEAGWPDGDYIEAFQDHVHEYLWSHGLIPDEYRGA